MEKTISAISTPVGTGGISVIRISGSQAFFVAEGMFKSKTPFSQIKSHTVTYGAVVDKEDQILDRVLLLKMQAPNSYTKEDVVEIHCHGGMYITSKILDLTFQNGAIPALPGEFTKRAFINGQMDLMEAEAVIDLINAEAEISYKDAFSQLKGEKSRKIKEIRKELIDLLSHIMVTMDYPEYDIEKATVNESKKRAGEIKEKLEELIDNFDNKRIIREGLNVAVTGDVNVGKSTFINLACGHNRVIVTDIAGTTRDVVEVKIDIKGLCVNLKDTAGIRRTDDLIEKIGIEKSIEAIEEADAIIYIADINQPFNKDLFKYIKDKSKVIGVLNKTDLLDSKDKESYIKEKENELAEYLGDRIISCSLDKKEGIDQIFDKVLEMIDIDNIRQNTSVITNSRHKYHVVEAINYLDSLDEGDFLDMLSVDLTLAAEELGKVTGETASTDIIDGIFQNFCLGK